LWILHLFAALSNIGVQKALKILLFFFASFVYPVAPGDGAGAPL